MFSPALCVKWGNIVDKFCFSVGWQEHAGVKYVVKRVQVWDTLNPCKCAHLVTIWGNDTAKQWQSYRTVTIKKPHSLTIKPFCKWFRDPDGNAPKLPYLKDTKNCPMDVTRANMSMTGFEICMLQMCVVSEITTDEYRCLQDSVPIDPKKLINELTKIEQKIKSSLKSAFNLRKCYQAVPPSETWTLKDKTP